MYYYGGYSGDMALVDVDAEVLKVMHTLHTDIAVMDMVTMVMEIVPLLY